MGCGKPASSSSSQSWLKIYGVLLKIRKDLSTAGFSQTSKTGCWCLTQSQLCENNSNHINNNNNNISINNNIYIQILERLCLQTRPFYRHWTNEGTNERTNQRTNEWTMWFFIPICFMPSQVRLDNVFIAGKRRIIMYWPTNHKRLPQEQSIRGEIHGN